MIASMVVTVLVTVSLFTGPIAWAAQPSGDDDGRRVFEANCAMCHGSDASGMLGMHPSLRGAVERLSRDGVDITIRRGRDTNPPMPAFEGRLTDREIDQVIGYVESLPSGPRNFGPEADGSPMTDGMMGGGWMWLLPIVLVVAIALVAVAIVRAGRDRPRHSAGPSPRELLDQRYASGDIDREEYLERRSDLES